MQIIALTHYTCSSWSFLPRSRHLEQHLLSVSDEKLRGGMWVNPAFSLRPICHPQWSPAILYEDCERRGCLKMESQRIHEEVVLELSFIKEA